MFVGVFLGCSPLLGLQTALCFICAYLFRLNKLAVLAGLQISTPPITAVVILGSIQLGHVLIYGTGVDLSLKMIHETPTKELLSRFSIAFALGGTVMGVILGAFFGSLTTWAVKRRRASDLLHPPVADGEIDALYDRLDAVPRKYRHYAAWKVRLDPLYPLALPLLAGRKEVVDLGAGMGILAALLHARSPQTALRCVEWDAEKAGVARTLMAGVPEVTVLEGDGREAPLGAPDAICLFDVLHYSPIDVQQGWVTRCAEALAPGGLLLIRELDPERGSWGLAEKIERGAVKRGWNQGAGVHAWPISSLRATLEGLGLKVEVQQAGKGLFSANALVTARKPTQGGGIGGVGLR